MAGCRKGCVTELDKSNLLWLKCIDSLAQVASHGCIPLQINTHIDSQGGTWADEQLREMQTVHISHSMPHAHTWTSTHRLKPQIDGAFQWKHVLPFIVLLQSSDYNPQQEALMKKQAATLEEIKTLTNQVHTLTPGYTCFCHSGGY